MATTDRRRHIHAGGSWQQVPRAGDAEQTGAVLVAVAAHATFKWTKDDQWRKVGVARQRRKLQLVVPGTAPHDIKTEVVIGSDDSN